MPIYDRPGQTLAAEFDTTTGLSTRRCITPGQASRRDRVVTDAAVRSVPAGTLEQRERDRRVHNQQSAGRRRAPAHSSGTAMTWRVRRARGMIAGVPAATRRRLGAQERFYVGRRPEQTEVFVVTLRNVERLRPRAHRRDAAFEWGSAADPSSAELAFAILCHTTRREPPERVCAQFHVDVVASLPHAGFVLGCDDVALWLAAEQRDAETWRPATRPRRRRVKAVLSHLGAGLTRGA